MNYRSGALCVVIRDSKILMVKHNRGGKQYYTLPGGGIEPGETPEEAVLRELWEECSVSGKIIKKLGAYHPSYSGDTTIHSFHVDIGSQAPKLGENLSAEELQVLQEVRWMALDEICERDRAFLWSAGLLGVQVYFDEVTHWSNDISYPSKR